MGRIQHTYREYQKVLRRGLYFSPLFLQTLVWPATRFVLCFFGRLKISGKENLKYLKSNQGVIFASNHSSELDPILLPASLPFFSKLMPIFYTSREKTFYKNSGWRQFFYGGLFFELWGAHAVRPGLQNYAKSLETHIRLVEEGKSVMIFPEGKIPEDKTIHPENAKGGLGFMAYKTEKVVVPVRISGAYHLSFWKFFLRGYTLNIHFFKPVTFKSFVEKISLKGEKVEPDLKAYKLFSQTILQIVASGDDNL